MLFAEPRTYQGKFDSIWTSRIKMGSNVSSCRIPDDLRVEYDFTAIEKFNMEGLMELCVDSPNRTFAV